MGSKTENSRPAFTDTLLLLVAVVMLLGGMGAYYYYQNLAGAPYRVAGLIAITLLASWVAAQTSKGGAFFRFLKEADIERRKVVWPTHQETVQTALTLLLSPRRMPLTLKSPKLSWKQVSTYCAKSQ